ncbi:hypothetical protein WKW77_34070 [Variovorax ureilyticus]|uniref:Uncharacterized protein n=1 Tax=Variovorax ureilyticus TaxID=1836198 RepID=A0ABU8VRK6_9BURK
MLRIVAGAALALCRRPRGCVASGLRFDARGRPLDVNLDDTYDKVRAAFGVQPTQGSY